LTGAHIDGEARTYSASLDNYRDGYRLNARLDVPRSNDIPGQFQLCTQCHTAVLGTISNFRYDRIPVRYLHPEHLSFVVDDYWDSDVDTIADSAMSCPTCHNIHGSPMDVSGALEPNRVMIRHGELTGTVPGLNFHWYTETGGQGGSGVQTSDRDASRSGQLYTAGPSCAIQYCHSTTPYYDRDPLASAIVVKAAYTCNDSGQPQTVFAPKEPIQFHIVYDVQGDLDTQYKVKAFFVAFGRTYEKKAWQYPGTDYVLIKDRDQGKRIKVPNTAAGKTKTIVYKVKLKLPGELLDKEKTTSQITVTGP
jgi:hypothetical protein